MGLIDGCRVGSGETKVSMYFLSFYGIIRNVRLSLNRSSGLRKFVEEVVHCAEDFDLIGSEHVVIGVVQTDHLS